MQENEAKENSLKKQRTMSTGEEMYAPSALKEVTKKLRDQLETAKKSTEDSGSRHSLQEELKKLDREYKALSNNSGSNSLICEGSPKLKSTTH